MVDVQVHFSCLCTDSTRREWTHEFNVQKGSTIRKLKQIMLLPKGSKEDAANFELRRACRRVPDYEQIWRTCAFDFGYLGPELGTKRTALDDAREAGTADEELALGGWWLCHSPGELSNQPQSQIRMLIRHQPGSDRFTGEVTGLGSMEGRVDGKDLSYEVGPFSVRGRVGDLGRTLLDLKSWEKGVQVAAFEARRIFDDDCWVRHPCYDLRGRGDVERMPGNDLEVVRRRVERMGYAGFSLWQGTAFLKKGGKPLYKEDLDYCGDEHPVEFHLFAPPDPYEESLADNSVSEHDVWQQQEQPERPREQRAAVADPVPARTTSAAREVEVVVRHAMKEMASQLTVKVRSDATILDVRRAVLVALGDAKLSEVKLVRRAGQGFASLEDGGRLGERRELLAMGRTLVPGAASSKTAAALAAAPAAPAPRADLAAAAPAAKTATAFAPVAAAAPASPLSAASPAAARSPAVQGTGAAPPSEELSVRLTSEGDEEAELEFSVRGTSTAQDLVDRILGGAGRGRVGDGVQLYVYDIFLDTVDRNLAGQELLSGLEKLELRNLRLGGAPLPASVPAEASPAEEAARAAKATKAVEDARAVVNAAKAAAVASATSAAVATVRASSALAPQTPARAKEAPRAMEMTVMVVVDRDLEITIPVQAKQGSTVGELKVRLAAQDATGQAKPGDFALVVPGQAGAAPLSDATRLTEAHAELELAQ